MKTTQVKKVATTSTFTSKDGKVIQLSIRKKVQQQAANQERIAA